MKTRPSLPSILENELSIRNAVANVFLIVPHDRMYVEVLKIILKAFASPIGIYGYIDEHGDLVIPSLTGKVWSRCRIPGKANVFPRSSWGGATWCRALLGKKSFLVNKPSRNIPRGHLPIKRHMAVPIVYRGKAIGLLQVANKKSDYSRDDLRLLGILADKIAPLLSPRLANDRLERESRTAREHTLHLNVVLRAVRNVNQLVNQEKRRDQLLQGVCDELVRGRGYECAHIAMLDENRNFTCFAQAGPAEEGIQFRELLLRGRRLPCVQRILERAENLVLGDPSGLCAKCPLASHLADKHTFVARLYHDSDTYGILMTCLPKSRPIHQEESTLLAEMAADLSLGLHGIELEESRRSMERELRQRNRELQERLKERTLLYGALKLATDPTQTLEQILQNIASAMPGAFQYPETAGVRITLVDATYQSMLFRETKWRLTIPIKPKDHEIGRIDVCYMHAPPESDGANFLKEEIQLTESIAAQIGDLVGRRRGEEALRESEQNLRQIQKMDAIGQLAGGIAHDFNNLAAVVMGYSDLLLRDEMITENQRARVERIRQSAERAAKLTQQLLAFGRRQPQLTRVINLNELIKELHGMQARLLGEDINLVLNLNPQLGSVKADPGQIQQVLVNLLLNSRDAMPSGGQITIETGNVELSRDFVERHPGSRPGPHVMLAVRDTGHGMDSETQSRVFEPFFTTKDREKGSGLGLSSAYGIVKQSEGCIFCQSTPGQGTTFILYFPRLEEKAEILVVNTPLEASAGTETILLVEDEDAVRDILAEMLTMVGYRVLIANNAQEALEICRRHKETIHLLLTDVIMPGMDGVQLAGQFSKLRPQAKVIYISGYLQNHIVKREILLPGMPLIQKPFGESELLRKIREILDA